MYRVAEVAKMLGVDNTEIYEKLISHKSILDSAVSKEEGINMISERGVEILSTLLGSHADYELAEPQEEKKQLTKHDKDRQIIKSKIDILNNEIDALDEEISVKDQKIQVLTLQLLEILGLDIDDANIRTVDV